jgi:predicted thioesterase
MGSVAERSATVSRTVTAGDTAASWGPDFPPAASTPFVLGLAEVACHEAVAKDLTGEEITVGTGATIDHLTASPVGVELVARARLVARDGRRLRFEVEVHEGDVLAARVSHSRAAVERSRITARLERP